VAHRLSTVRRCDCVVELENGIVKAYGSFDELQLSSASFEELANLDTESIS